MATPSIAAEAHLWAVVDPDIAKENQVEDKHRRLVRSHRSSPYDRELKPNAKIRDELDVSASVSTCRSWLKESMLFLSGYIELRTQSAINIRGERSDLAIQSRAYEDYTIGGSSSRHLAVSHHVSRSGLAG